MYKKIAQQVSGRISGRGGVLGRRQGSDDATKRLNAVDGNEALLSAFEAV